MVGCQAAGGPYRHPCCSPTRRALCPCKLVRRVRMRRYRGRPEADCAMSTPGTDPARRSRVVLAPEIAEIAGSVAARLPDLVDRVVQRILAEIEFYRDRDVVSLEDLRDSVRGNLASMVGQLTTVPPPDLSAPRGTGRQRARQGTPLADILHAYRIGFAELWEAIVDEARQRTQAPSEMLVDAASVVWWLIGEYTQELTMAYREAAAELLLAGARERSALVEALFTGGIPDRDTLWEAAKLLRLPWEGVFVVVAVEAPGLAQEGLPDAEALLAGRGIGSAWQLHPDVQMGVVSLRRPDTIPLLVELLERSVRARAGISPVYRSLAETPRALHYARLVQSSLPPGVPAVAQFEETPLRVLAAAAPDAAAAPRSRPASGSIATPTRCGTGCAGCRSTPAAPWTTRERWPSCWPPWMRCACCQGRAGRSSAEAALPALWCARAHGGCGRRQLFHGVAVRRAIALGAVGADAASRTTEPGAEGDDGELGPEPVGSNPDVPGQCGGPPGRSGHDLPRAGRTVRAGGWPAGGTGCGARRPGRPDAAERRGVPGALLRGAPRRRGGGADEPAAEGARGGVLPRRLRRQADLRLAGHRSRGRQGRRGRRDRLRRGRAH